MARCWSSSCSRAVDTPLRVGFVAYVMVGTFGLELCGNLLLPQVRMSQFLGQPLSGYPSGTTMWWTGACRDASRPLGTRMATGLAARMALECRARMARRYQYRRAGLAMAYAERGGRGPAAGHGLDGRLFETALTPPCITDGRVDGPMTIARRLPGRTERRPISPNGSCDLKGPRLEEAGRR